MGVSESWLCTYFVVIHIAGFIKRTKNIKEAECAISITLMMYNTLKIIVI